MKNLTIVEGKIKMVASDEKEFDQLCTFVERSFDNNRSFEYFTFDLDYSIYIRFNKEDAIVKLKKEFESLFKKS